jgi:hypothetical protein
MPREHSTVCLHGMHLSCTWPGCECLCHGGKTLTLAEDPQFLGQREWREPPAPRPAPVIVADWCFCGVHWMTAGQPDLVDNGRLHSRTRCGAPEVPPP